MDLIELEAGLVSKVSSRTAMTVTWRNPVSKQTDKQTTTTTTKLNRKRLLCKDDAEERYKDQLCVLARESGCCAD